MDVAVVEAGEQGLAGGLDHLGRWPDQALDFLPGPRVHDPIPPDGHRLDNSGCGVDRDQLPGPNDQIGGCGIGGEQETTT